MSLEDPFIHELNQLIILSTSHADSLLPSEAKGMNKANRSVLSL